MDITYTNILEDQKEYLYFLLTSKEHGKKLRVYALITLETNIIMVSFLLGLLAWGLSLGVWKDGLMFAFLSFVLGQFIFPITAKFRPIQFYGKKFINTKLKKMSAKEMNLFLLPKNLSVTKEWLEIEIATQVHRWQWNIIENVFLLESLIVINVDSTYRYLVPNRAFETEDDFLDFGNHLLEYSSMSKKK